MDGAVANHGGGGGGGGPTVRSHPLLVFLLVLSVHALDSLLEIRKKKGSQNSEYTQLRQEIKQLLKEASSLSTPSTFAEAAKLRRTAAAKERELLKKQAEQSKDSKSAHELYARVLLFLKVLLFTGLSWCFWSDPVAAVPQSVLQPFGRFLSLSTKDSAMGLTMIGIIPWLVLTSRVSKFLCQKASKIIAPK